MAIEGKGHIQLGGNQRGRTGELGGNVVGGNEFLPAA